MQHAASVTTNPNTGTVQVECSCGEWVGAPVADGPPVLREHRAMAEWAAHVHVADGLAVPES